MSDIRDVEFEAQMSDVAEEAATGVAAIKKGAKPGESIDTSGDKSTTIGGTDSKTEEGAKGTSNLGAKAAAPVSVEGDKSIKTKPSAASAKMEETEEDGEETLAETQYDFTEDVDALVAGEELSEDFRERAVTIFEAAVTAKVNAEVTAVQEAFESTLTEQVEQIKTELATKVDDYLSYAAQQWMEENTLAVEHGVKNEIAESFMSGLKALFAEHHVGVPEEKFNLLDGMVEQIDDMEGKLNEQIESNISLNKRIGDFVKMEIVNDCAVGLTETQKEKLASLAEGVEFESEEGFHKKITTIKESYFTRKESATVDPTEDIEPLVEETQYNGPMGAYVDALSRWSQS